MGSSPSKPSTTARTKRKISKPTPPTPHAPASYSYPYLEPLPFRPLPHHPTASRPTAEEELYRRVAHFQQRPAPEPASRAPARSAPQMSRAGHAVAVAAVDSKTKVSAKASAKTKAPPGFKPLSEIGASPRPPKAATSKPQGPTPPSARNNNVNRGNGYGLYPPPQRGDYPGTGTAQPAGRKLPKGAKFGGTRRDRDGEWWVLVLADGRWHRSREMGLEPPAVAVGGRF